MLASAFGNAEAKAEVSGEKRTFTITGYYSPLPNQSYYVTGSYAGDIRLNGRGIRGADGTGVYPGMIAAPYSYPFGTKICIPNFGCGTVHDRGGAIVEKGKRQLAKHDRLDLWMGYGDEGLRRALAWGVPHLECEMFGADAPVEDSVNFQVPPQLYQVLDVPEKKMFNKNLKRGYAGELVSQLQEALQKLGFYDGPINGSFDYNVKNSVLAFQKKYFVVYDENELGAGVFGPKTRRTLEEELHRFEIQQKIRTLWEDFHFDEKLKFGMRNQSVLKLQELLVQGEFLDHVPTGYFGEKTKTALIEFQIANGLIRNKHQVGAGKVGPKTTEFLNEVINGKKDSLASEKAEILAYEKTRVKLRFFAGKLDGVSNLYVQN